MSSVALTHRLTAIGITSLLGSGLLSTAAPVPLDAAAAQASGPTLAQCEAAGRAGVRAGDYDSYHCEFVRGGWHLFPE